MGNRNKINRAISFENLADVSETLSWNMYAKGSGQRFIYLFFCRILTLQSTSKIKVAFYSWC